MPEISVYHYDILGFQQIEKKDRILLKIDTRKHFEGKDFLIFNLRDKSALDSFKKLTKFLEDIVKSKDNQEWKPSAVEKERISALKQN